MEYKFRGQDIETKEWDYGGIYETHGEFYIVDGTGRNNLRAVIKESVGPQTGVKDINKKESYLGDILKEHLTEWSSKKDIEHTKKCFCIIKKESDSNNMYLEYNFNIRGYWETNNIPISRITYYEIVGNIFENADIIKKEV